MNTRFLYMTLVWLASITSMNAADGFVIKPVTIPQGGETEFQIGFSFDSETNYVGFQLDIELPEGITTIKDEDGIPVYSKDENSCGKLTMVPTSDDGFGAIPQTTSARIQGKQGILFSISLQADESLVAGTEMIAKVTNAMFTMKDENGDLHSVDMPDYTFNITIGNPADNRVLLDENATAVPKNANGVDIRVKRTINANVWSTLCLPFAMTGNQVKEVFGSDTELADFDGIESETDDDDNIVGITVKFTPTSSIEANHPYLIKVSKIITEFTLDGVDVIVEDEPSIDKDAYTVGKGKTAVTFYNRMIGTYCASGTIPSLCLFVSEGKFWYSTGKTSMKGMRAYFDFYDVLADVEDTSNIKIRIGDATTGINLIMNDHTTNNSVYDLGGRALDGVQRGINITNGKKVYQQ